MIKPYEEKLVSIITPTYNSRTYIEQTINSVINQTYKEWELIIVDDCSTDNIEEIIKTYLEKDPRIKFIKLEVNSGAAKARNKALSVANGRFIAYLDSDDIWYNNKLEVQVKCMIENKWGFSCTAYEVIGDDGKSKNKKIYMKEEVDYRGFLINNLIQTVGVMIDLKLVNKNYIFMPDMRRRQDAATWLQILNSGQKCYGINEILAAYRRTEGSLSSNKFKAVSGVWYLYRHIEKLSLIQAVYCFTRYAVLAVWKRIYI